jgi:hypothetical protein
MCRSSEIEVLDGSNRLVESMVNMRVTLTAGLKQTIIE